MTDILDQALLATLDTPDGLSLGAVLGAAPSAPQPTTTSWLTTHEPRWRALGGALAHHVEHAASRIDRPLVVEHAAAKAFPAGNVGRRFDPRWFDSPIAFFQLAAIVNRLDRREFAPTSCGELRLVYRLAYRTTGTPPRSSRLPLTLNVVLTAPRTADCRAVAEAWQHAAPPDADWVRARLQGERAPTVKQIEVNAQVVRFPSGLETEFGGQASSTACPTMPADG